MTADFHLWRVSRFGSWSRPRRAAGRRASTATRRAAGGTPPPAAPPARLPSCLSVRRWDADDEVHLAFVGELDLAADAPARAAIRDALCRRPRRLVIDLRGLTFMDSTGTSILLAAQADADARGWTLRLRIGPVVARVFELSGIADRFRAERA